MLAPRLADNLQNLSGIRHGFFTREGGASQGIYASLNCGLGSNDAADQVLENRLRVAQHLEGRGGGVVTLYQEHGTTAREVTALPDRAALPRADAVISTTPGLVIGVLTADCAPVLLADAEARVVAAAHAGWRGALDGIVESAIAEMERLGARRERISAAVGPCIGPKRLRGRTGVRGAVRVARFRAPTIFHAGQRRRHGRISICQASSCTGCARRASAMPSISRCAPMRTNRFSSAIDVKQSAMSPITAVKSPPSSWPNRTIHSELSRYTGVCVS